MGDTCTRGCRFCAIGKGKPQALNPEEPYRVGQTVKELGLEHIVVTSVDRDDLPDGGAAHLARTVVWIRTLSPGTRVEVLIPDFKGDRNALQTVVRSGIDVLNHNIETVPSLYRKVRPGSIYRRSLGVLRETKEIRSDLLTKSGLMLGLGETRGEILTTLEDLREAGCDILTLGQYLQPTPDQLPVERYLEPAEFESLKRDAVELGFRHVESGPLVRSSYHAWSHVH
jgi:lipoic acid synthetase